MFIFIKKRKPKFKILRRKGVKIKTIKKKENKEYLYLHNLPPEIECTV
jgi:hypothetical protein